MRKFSKGQSLVEVVFSVGIIVLVLTAVASLIVSSLHSRTSGYDRKKAAELGQKVMETLVEEKDQDPINFWDVGSTGFWRDKNLGTTQTMTGYPGYSYAISFTQVSVGNSCPITPMRCASAIIGVGFSSDVANKVTFTRFFSR